MACNKNKEKNSAHILIPVSSCNKPLSPSVKRFSRKFKALNEWTKKDRNNSIGTIFEYHCQTKKQNDLVILTSFSERHQLCEMQVSSKFLTGYAATVKMMQTISINPQHFFLTSVHNLQLKSCW